MRNDGGPAFPVTPDGTMPGEGFIVGGMSLRDYFAAAALQGMLSLPAGLMDTDANEPMIDPPQEKFAQWAYEYADAMLTERDKP